MYTLYQVYIQNVCGILSASLLMAAGVQSPVIYSEI